MKKKRKVIIPVIVVTALAAVYAAGCVYFNSHLMPDKKLLDAEATGMDREDIVSALQDSVNSYSLTLQGDTTSDVIAGNDVSLEIDSSSARKAADTILESQNIAEWPLSFFHKKKNVRVPQMSASLDETALSEKIDGTSAVTQEPQKSVNATYRLDGNKFAIVDEVYGTEIRKDRLTDCVTDAMKSLTKKISLRDSGCYVDPEIKKNNKQLNKTVKTLNKYMKPTITYDLGSGKTLKVKKADQAKWLGVDKNGDVSFDTDAMYNYVKMSLGYRYNTMGIQRKLKTQYDRTVTISGGNYGWWINYDEEVAQLKKDLQGGKNVKREFIYRSRAANHGPGAYDYGDSYAEVNIATQHMFLVIKGKVVLESDFVSGKMTDDRRTPTGAYAITYKTKDAELKGRNYVSHVSWWMPFNGNIGFHDAPWRHGRFGGSIYRSNGSHGCVNLPPATAEKLYPYVEKGFPVLIYYYDPKTGESQTIPPQVSKN